jgi:putative peptide maturation system protein
VDLLVDAPPASDTVDYDILLHDPAGGVVALSWRPGGQTPWGILYSDHWASNYVASVDDHHMTVQQALTYLRLRGESTPDLLAEIEEQLLIGRALEEDPPEVSEAEVSNAARAFRVSRGLLSAEAAAHWLRQSGLSEKQFENLMRRQAGINRLIDRVAGAAEVETCWNSRSRDFERVSVASALISNWNVAATLVEKARQTGLLSAAESMAPHSVEAEMRTHFAIDLPPAIAFAPAGALTQPEAEPAFRIRIRQVVARAPAALNDVTRQRIRDLLFSEWLAAQKQVAAIRWHWF